MTGDASYRGSSGRQAMIPAVQPQILSLGCAARAVWPATRISIFCPIFWTTTFGFREPRSASASMESWGFIPGIGDCTRRPCLLHHHRRGLAARRILRHHHPDDRQCRHRVARRRGAGSRQPLRHCVESESPELCAPDTQPRHARGASGRRAGSSLPRWPSPSPACC